jgi:putative membrane protein insertion efficiency factor
MERVVILLLKIFKYTLSPLLPPACRFTPTCSEYAADAVAQYGALKGTAMGCDGSFAAIRFRMEGMILSADPASPGSIAFWRLLARP